MLDGGALVHLPIPTATLSLAITGAGWDLQYVCQSMSGTQLDFLKGLFLQISALKARLSYVTLRIR